MTRLVLNRSDWSDSVLFGYCQWLARSLHPSRADLQTRLIFLLLFAPCLHHVCCTFASLPQMWECVNVSYQAPIGCGWWLWGNNKRKPSKLTSVSSACLQCFTILTGNKFVIQHWAALWSFVYLFLFLFFFFTGGGKICTKLTFFPLRSCATEFNSDDCAARVTESFSVLEVLR